MNERIRELMEQASVHACYDEPRQICLMNSEIEQFAELIIKDCSCVPTDMWGEGELDVHTAVQVHRKILKHFGVNDD